MSAKYRQLISLFITLFVLTACDNDSSTSGGTANRVTLKDNNGPVITLISASVIVVEGGSSFVDPGSTVEDSIDLNLVATVTGTVDTTKVGSYTLQYNVTDTSGNAASTVTRTVNVVDTTVPMITLTGTNPLTVEGGSPYVEPGTVVTDNVDTALTATVTGSVNTAVVGTYLLSYNVTDSLGNVAATVTRTVNIVDTSVPVITLAGDNPMYVLKDEVFTEPGSTVTDNIDKALVSTISGTVNSTAIGSYLLNYDAKDSAGNTAATVTRTVNIILLAPPVPSMTVAMKRLEFTWPLVTGADHYRILVNPDGMSGFTVDPTAASITVNSHILEIPVHLTNWLSAQYIVESCNAAETVCVSSTTQSLTVANSIAAIGYFKASNTDLGDWFGQSVSLSADGNTLAVGSVEDSAATGINNTTPGQSDNSASGSGAVYVFARSGLDWVQQAYIKASNAELGDDFGMPVTLSADGNTLVVSALGEDSAATGIDGDELDNSLSNPGAAYVYVRSGSTWTQQTYIKASNTDVLDGFGHAISLSNDGNTLAISAYYEDSAATGVNNTIPGQFDNNASYAGAVYVFVRASGTWTQQAYVKSSNNEANDYFGKAISLSDDGNMMAVSTASESSASVGVDSLVPGQGDNSATRSGAVYVFIRVGTDWSQQSYIKASNTETMDWFGLSVALSADGTTLAVGAGNEDSASAGINSTTPGQGDNTAPDSGAVYVFTLSGSIWSQQAYIKSSTPDAGDYLGRALDLSSDGNVLAVQAFSEDSAARGIGGDELDNTSIASAAVYVFVRTGSTWSQKNYVKASNTDANDWFGYSVSLSGDGNTLAIGAANEGSAATGINGDQADNNAFLSGAVYLY